MLTDPRSIAFIVDCIHPQVRHEAQALQKLYAKAMDDSRLGYTNFNAAPGGGQMTTVHGPASLPGATSHSTLSFGPDRFQVKEEWTQLTLDDFIDRSRAAVGFCLDELTIPMVAVIQCVVRCLVTVQGVKDSREYFNENFFHMDEDSVALLGRQVNLFGLRLVFPATPDDQSLHNVRIESFNGDVQSMFLEECGVYSTPLTRNALDPLETAIRHSYDFLTDNVTAYLRRP